MRRLTAIVALAVLLPLMIATPPAAVSAQPDEGLSHLMVSDDRFLVDQDGAPFFWLGDTAWELFHRLTRAEASLYLQDRQDKNFNVVQLSPWRS